MEEKETAVSVMENEIEAMGRGEESDMPISVEDFKKELENGTA